jgi:hypothetical protein
VTNPINRKLRPEDILEIRRAYAAGEASLSVLGIRFKVSRQHIHRVLEGVKPPRHVSGMAQGEAGQDTPWEGGQATTSSGPERS